MKSCKTFALILVSVFLMLLAVPAGATYGNNQSRIDYNHTVFVDEWENTVTYYYNNLAVAKKVYGYDTDGANEDYVWTKSFVSSSNSQAKVRRYYYAPDNGNYISGPVKGVNKYSKIEVRHKSDYVIYRIELDNELFTYSNISYVIITGTGEKP